MMRSEREMFDLILSVAAADERIRGVYMNGSRTNQNVKKDLFQDYDIVYAVRETKPFYENEQWIDLFGERLFMQCPEKVDRGFGLDVNFDKGFGWLIQFKDGNRLDLHVVPVNKADVLGDKLCMILLDKDAIFPPIPEPSDEDYRIKKPSQSEFSSCCNEFWWCLNNVAKGLWREEIPYVHQAYYEGSHPQLVKLLNWSIGYRTDFKISTGKASKYLKSYLSDQVWNRFLETYITGNIAEIWHSVFVMCGLFHETALDLAEQQGFSYCSDEAKACLGFLKHVQSLPKDAESIY